MGGGSNRSRRERGSCSCEKFKSGSPKAMDFAAGQPWSRRLRGAAEALLAAGACAGGSLRVARVGGAGAPWRRAALEAGAWEAAAAA